MTVRTSEGIEFRTSGQCLVEGLTSNACQKRRSIRADRGIARVIDTHGELRQGFEDACVFFHRGPHPSFQEATTTWGPSSLVGPRYLAVTWLRTFGQVFLGSRICIGVPPSSGCIRRAT